MPSIPKAEKVFKLNLRAWPHLPCPGGLALVQLLPALTGALIQLLTQFRADGILLLCPEFQAEGATLGRPSVGGELGCLGSSRKAGLQV